MKTYLLTTFEERNIYHWICTAKSQQEAEKNLIKQYLDQYDSAEPDDYKMDMNHFIYHFIDGYADFLVIENNQITSLYPRVI